MMRLLYSLQNWWNKLLIVKEEHMPSATDLFHKEGIQITLQGRTNLGAALDSRSFIEEYVTSKVAS